MPKHKLTTVQVAALNKRRKSSTSSPVKAGPALSIEQLQKAREATRSKLQHLLEENRPPSPEADESDENRASHSASTADKRHPTPERLPEERTSHEPSLSEQIGQDIEETLYEMHGTVDSGYKTDFRRLFTSLKDTKTNYRALLLDGVISGPQFARMPLEELLSEQRRKSDATLKQEAIRLSTLPEVQPSDINTLKDGREREKWGVGRSAASVDE